MDTAHIARDDDAPQTWIAVVLSLLCTGLGHLYCGRTRRGLVLFLASMLFTPAVVAAALAPPSRAALIALGVVTASVVGLYLFAVLDAWRIARAQQRGAPVGGWRPGSVLLGLFVVVGLLYPVGSMLLVRAHYLEAFKIPMASMRPTFLPGDRILVDKLVFGHTEPERGQVVVFRHPTERKMFVKRIVGLGGDRIRIAPEGVFLNGSVLPREPALDDPVAGDSLYWETLGDVRYQIVEGLFGSGEYDEVTVPDGQVYLLGDNRPNSEDSRRFGPVARGNLVGPARYVFWPAGSWSRFGVVK